MAPRAATRTPGHEGQPMEKPSRARQPWGRARSKGWFPPRDVTSLAPREAETPRAEPSSGAVGVCSPPRGGPAGCRDLEKPEPGLLCVARLLIEAGARQNPGHCKPCPSLTTSLHGLRETGSPQLDAGAADEAPRLTVGGRCREPRRGVPQLPAVSESLTPPGPSFCTAGWHRSTWCKRSSCRVKQAPT